MLNSITLLALALLHTFARPPVLLTAAALPVTATIPIAVSIAASLASLPSLGPVAAMLSILGIALAGLGVRLRRRHLRSN